MVSSLAPQASASAYSATRTCATAAEAGVSRLTIANPQTIGHGRCGRQGCARARKRECDDDQMTDISPPAAPRGTAAQDEVASLASDLIRIDSSNPGDHSGPGERAAAERFLGAVLVQVPNLPPPLSDYVAAFRTAQRGASPDKTSYHH